MVDPAGTEIQNSSYLSDYVVEVLAIDGPAPSRVRIVFEKNVLLYQGAPKATEIDALLEDGPAEMAGAPSSSEAPGQKSLDEMVAMAKAARPGEVPVFMAFDNASPILTVTTAPAPDSPEGEMVVQLFNRTSGEPIGAVEGGGVMDFILQLHTDMFLGLAGMLFLAAMGILLTAALVSGVVLYAPFMRKLEFGTVRASRSRRLKWLDYHNLLGIVALAAIGGRPGTALR